MQVGEVLTWSLGGLIAAAGVTLAAWALFRDRSRGRPRCPRCWYDLSAATGAVCAECGHAPKRRRSVFRTRRRWRRALAGLAIVVVGLGFGWGAEVRRVGWARAAPNVAHIALFPHLPASVLRLRDRVHQGELRQWEYRLLVRRCVDALAPDADPNTLVAAIGLLSSVEWCGDRHGEERPWGSWAQVTEIGDERTLQVLVSLLDHEDPTVRVAAVEAIGTLGYAADALPALFAKLGGPDVELARRASTSLARQERTLGFLALAFVMRPRGEPPSDEEAAFAARFEPCGLDIDAAIPILAEGLDHENARVRALSVWGLGLAERRRPGVAGQMLPLIDDRSRDVRGVVMVATAAMPLDDRVVATFRSGLEKRNHVSNIALRALAERGAAAPMLLEPVAAHLEREPWSLPVAARCYVKIGGEVEVALDALIDALESGWSEPPRSLRVGAILEALGELDVESGRGQAAVRPWLEAGEPELRAAAGRALAMLGGDQEHATRVLVDAIASVPAGSRRTHWRWRHLVGLAEHRRLSVPIVLELLASEDPDTRGFAVQALSEMGASATSALDVLRDLRSDSDPNVARWADVAVQRAEYELDRAR